MKRFKKILINLVASIMLIASCFGLTACTEDITQIKVNVSVYNFTESEENGTVGFKDVTLTVDLYGHFAPNTVNTIVSYIKKGYYNDTVFYQSKKLSNQIMLGDFVADNGTIKGQTEVMPQIKGEFKHGGTSGSNLVAKKGVIGLWRTWYAYDGTYNVSNSAMNSGRATWFIPTSEMQATLSSYNDWFCLFACFDVENADNIKAFNLIQSSIEDSSATEYVVYYTGTYDSTKPNENFGLTQHIVLADEFVEDDIEDLFTAKEAQEVNYNHTTIIVPTVEIDGKTQIAAKVKSISVK